MQNQDHIHEPKLYGFLNIYLTDCNTIKFKNDNSLCVHLITLFIIIINSLERKPVSHVRRSSEEYKRYIHSPDLPFYNVKYKKTWVIQKRKKKKEKKKKKKKI